jgi:CheY-like chemotaxis protein
MELEKPRPLQIILIDDDVDDRALFREMIKNIDPGILLHEFKNGISFIRSVTSEMTLPPFDMIFMDINMPLKNGIECLRELRNDPRFNAVPIIVFTTSSNDKDIEASYTSKATLYIAKSFSFDQGVRMLQAVLDEYSQTGFKQITREVFARVSHKY